jgi:hypothetical protein
MTFLPAILSSLVVSTIPSPPLAQAVEQKKPLTKSQQRMVDCNKQAAGKKGDVHKAFLQACLKQR